ncbi:hypothetical protein BKA63DRAFT_555295 [Paraphoma chrysanthemicola]|nr:hypothetical protein BKA63DRAFT_555295 [Paraphoma chrysanthemicola]
MSPHHPNTPDFHHSSHSSPSPATRATAFLANHTAVLHSDPSPPLNTECPICLEGIEAHNCMKIVNVPGCEHLFGLKCLERMLKNDPDGEKECPLCHTVWYGEEEDGVWEEMGDGDELVQGGLGAGTWEGMEMGQWGDGRSEGGWEGAGHGHTPSVMTTSTYPQSPTLNAFPMDPFGLQSSMDVESHNQCHHASLHMLSFAALPTHRLSSTSYELLRPPRDLLLDTEHPLFVGEDGELMVWVVDDVYAQMERPCLAKESCLVTVLIGTRGVIMVAVAVRGATTEAQRVLLSLISESPVSEL